MSNYNFKEIEKKWQKYWEENKTFKTDLWDFSRPKFYALDMFSYPSGQGLHVGHIEGYTSTDIMSRMKRMQGFNVLHPVGFDSFGLPAEQYAIKTGNHPGTFTNENIKIFSKQLKEAGFDYDWDTKVSTCDPSFYKWTQWIFKQLYKAGYVKYVNMPVNWCEGLGTVLANDEIIDGKSERGGFPVVKKDMMQWVMEIPKYADRLLEGLNEIDWPESTKEMQRNWIGKSTGAEVTFNVFGTKESFAVFTTRCDTLFGATYCVLSPEHPLIDSITTEEKKAEVETYKKMCARKSDLERTDLNKEKTGVFTGAYAINPVNNKKIPIWISDYVLMSYGTGAIMAVPAHDERDYAFAKKFGLEIIEVLKGGDITKEAYIEDGVHVNSGFLDGLGKQEAIDKMIEWLESKKIGKKKVNYKLREWIFARQRYWGEPVPVIHLENGKDVLVEDKDLPLLLPELTDYKPGKDGASPLEKASDWVNVVVNGIKGKRETSTMPGSAGSSWYFLRYIDSHNDKEFANKELLKHWLPVDLYVGGSEHAVGHLLYSRFWTNFLYDQGLVPVKEPFKKLVHQGMILGSNGEKMSKSRGNVINPDDVINEYGADTLRMYEMFMGPIQASKPWDDSGILGSKRFLERIWRLYTEENKIKDEENPNLDYVYNFTVKKVSDDYETMNFNTAISQMMMFVNAVYKENVFPKKYAEGFLKLLNPLVPHISEELNEYLGNKECLATSTWPSYDASKLEKSDVEIAIQVNGKLRGTIKVNKDEDDEVVKKVAFEVENVKRNIEGKEIKKVIVVKNKIVNIVVI